MVVRFEPRPASVEISDSRTAFPPARRAAPRILTAREIAHRERMLQYLQSAAGDRAPR
jgi:hypothetical protein